MTLSTSNKPYPSAINEDNDDLPSSAISLRLLCSLDWRDLYVPQARTVMAETRAFAVIGPALWIQPTPSFDTLLLIYVFSRLLSCLGLSQDRKTTPLNS